MARPSVPKRSDPAKIRQQQQMIADDYVNRERARLEGDVVSPPRPAISPPARPQPIKGKRRTNPTSRQGIVTGFQKGSTTI